MLCSKVTHNTALWKNSALSQHSLDDYPFTAEATDEDPKRYMGSNNRIFYLLT